MSARWRFGTVCIGSTLASENSCFANEKNSGCFFCTHITKYTNRREWSRIKGTRKVQSRDFAPHTWTLKSSTLDSFQLIVRSVVVELRVSWKLSSTNSFSNHEGKSIPTLQKNGLQWETNNCASKLDCYKDSKNQRRDNNQKDRKAFHLLTIEITIQSVQFSGLFMQ